MGEGSGLPGVRQRVAAVEGRRKLGIVCYKIGMGNEMVPFREHAVFIVPDDGSQIDVRVTSETVWLTAAEMSELFGREASGIRRHIRNVFAEKEVPDDESYRKNLPVTSDTGGHPEPIYNLDVIISVGYRVKSQRGVAFRQWATRILKERLTGDLRRRVAESEQVLYGLKNIELLARSAATTRAEETPEVLALIEKYARSWHLLLQYDEKKLPPPPGEPSKRMGRLTPRQAAKIIDQFKRSLARKGQATDLFGRDRGDGLASILGNLEQTWGGQPVYPNVETRGAHLLYFVIKNHPFLDGNKRIGSLLFLHYLEKNSRPLLDESALVALALLVAESDPKQKDVVVRLIISLMQEATTPTSSLETH
jgi:prophage maintenance system killer protein